MSLEKDSHVEAKTCKNKTTQTNKQANKQTTTAAKPFRTKIGQDNKGEGEPVETISQG